jgi:diadenosine tetraphosphate (Ap4A) HIT family hydrolase
MQLDEHCESCGHANDPRGLIHQTKYWRLVLADDQAQVGRSVLILRNHKSSLDTLTADEWHDFERLVKIIEGGYEKAFDGGRPFNWACMMNNAFQQQPSHPHIHWHIRPRHAHPITIGKVTFTDPEYAHHYDHKRKQTVDAETYSLIIEKIKTYLDAEKQAK